jgi:hypothetical protein
MFRERLAERWFLVVCEFSHFYIHLMNRISLNKLGDEGRRKLNGKVVPHLFNILTNAAVTDPISPRDREWGLTTFTESNYDREVIYSKCTKYVSSENLLDGSALFSKLALMVIDACGFPPDEILAKAVIGVSYETYKNMNLLALVEAAGQGI